MIERTQGKLIVVSGPSGVGKSTICGRLVERHRRTVQRLDHHPSQAAAEVDGRDYWFVTRETFEQVIRDDVFLEYAEVFGNYYGTPRVPVEAAMKDGQNRDPRNRCSGRHAK